MIEQLREYVRQVPPSVALKVLNSYLDRVPEHLADGLEGLISEIEATSMVKQASGLTPKTLIRLAYANPQVRERYSDLLLKVAESFTTEKNKATKAIGKAHRRKKKQTGAQKAEALKQGRKKFKDRDFKHLPPEVQHAYTQAKRKWEQKGFKNESGNLVKFDSLNERDKEHFHKVLVERALTLLGKSESDFDSEEDEGEGESGGATSGGGGESGGATSGESGGGESGGGGESSEDAEKQEKEKAKAEKKKQSEEKAKARAEKLIAEAPPGQQEKLKEILNSQGADAVGQYLFGGGGDKPTQESEDVGAALDALKVASLIRVAYTHPHLRERALKKLGY